MNTELTYTLIHIFVHVILIYAIQLYYNNTSILIFRFYSRVLEEHRLTNDQNFMGNPINCFHFIKRMYHGWTNILNEIKCDDCLPKDRNHELSKLSFYPNKLHFTRFFLRVCILLQNVL